MGNFESMMVTAEDIRKKIVDRAGEDTDFRAEFVADPKAVISREFGVELPDSMRVHVHEIDMENAHIALPPLPELDEEQLERLAGAGGIGYICC